MFTISNVRQACRRNILKISTILTQDSLVWAQDSLVPSALQHRNYSMNWVPVELDAGWVPFADCMPHLYLIVGCIDEDKGYDAGLGEPGFAEAIE